MKLLLDTHLLIWSGYDLPQLPNRARTIIEAPEHELRFSSASIWEMAIKRSYGREDFQINIADLRAGLLGNDYEELPVTGEHALLVADLPPLHRDPFDRILIAQAVVEELTLVTADEQVAAYDGPILKV